jgi:hypothetical protein
MKITDFHCMSIILHDRLMYNPLNIEFIVDLGIQYDFVRRIVSLNYSFRII